MSLLSRHLATALLVGLTACRQPVLGAAVDDAPALRAAVERVVPLGTALDTAEVRLRARGFTCAVFEQPWNGPLNGLCRTPVPGGVPGFRQEVAVHLLAGAKGSPSATGYDRQHVDSIVVLVQARGNR